MNNIHLDHTTLLLVASCISFILAVNQVQFGFRRYGFRPSLDMGLASLFFAFRTLFHVFEVHLPRDLVIFAILSVGFEVILIYRAIRGSLGYSPMTRSDIIMFFVFMGLGFLAGFVTSYSMDQVIHSAYVFYFFSRAAYFTLKKSSRVPVSIQIFMLFYIISLCFIMVYRGVYYIFADIETELYSTDPLTAPTTFFVLLFFLIGNLGIFVLATTRILDDALEERDFAKTLISVIGHDLNGYIGGIHQASELAGDRPEEVIPIISRNSFLAQTLLTDLVYWGRSREGDLSISENYIPVETLVKEVVAQFETQMQGKNVHLELPEIFPECIIRADQVPASVVLRNILSNAVKFSYNNGVVRISCSRFEDRAMVEIADSGPGIAREIQDAVSTGKVIHSGIGSSGEKGLGVGLKIISSICRSSGWSLEFESESGKGTAVTVGFPLARVEDEGSAEKV